MSDLANRRMLCVFAHPDDECLGPGGTIARYASSGVDVFVLMFTRGEAGSIGISKELEPEELARRRLLELEGACRALGVKEHRVLGVPDKGVERCDRGRAVAEILSDIRRYRPQVVMTFHHRGVSGHPDHIAVASLLEEAFEASGDEGPLKYYGWGIPGEKARLYERPNLRPMADDEIAAKIDIDGASMDRKIAAIECHKTQIDFMRSMQRTFDYRSVSTPECFELRRTRLPRPAAVEDDLFSGVTS
jgi:LmbE family N-acetylglucosaminyl deacetylase